MSESALNVKIPTELKDEVKIMAMIRHTTLRVFVINALRDKLDEIAEVDNGVNAENS